MSFLDFVDCYKNWLKSGFNRWTLYRKKYKNYLHVMYKISRNQYPMVLKMLNGNNITCQTYRQMWDITMGLDCDPNEDIVYVNGFKFYGGKKIEDTALISQRRLQISSGQEQSSRLYRCRDRRLVNLLCLPWR